MQYESKQINTVAQKMKGIFFERRYANKKMQK